MINYILIVPDGIETKVTIFYYDIPDYFNRTRWN